MSKKTTTINSSAYAFMKSILSPKLKVIDLYVKGKWLVAELDSGIKFSVLNKDLSTS